MRQTDYCAGYSASVRIHMLLEQQISENCQQKNLVHNARHTDVDLMIRIQSVDLQVWQ